MCIALALQISCYFISTYLPKLLNERLKFHILQLCMDEVVHDRRALVVFSKKQGLDCSSNHRFSTYLVFKRVDALFTSRIIAKTNFDDRQRPIDGYHQFCHQKFQNLRKADRTKSLKAIIS